MFQKFHKKVYKFHIRRRILRYTMMNRCTITRKQRYFGILSFLPSFIKRYLHVLPTDQMENVITFLLICRAVTSQQQEAPRPHQPRVGPRHRLRRRRWRPPQHRSRAAATTARDGLSCSPSSTKAPTSLKVRETRRYE